jgi:hypothetical protein
MVTVAIVTAGVLALASLPYWLPRAVVALRMSIFTRLNGGGAIAIPGPLVGVDRFKQVYSDPAADGRSRGAALSDLFWYWLSPGPEIHQEHLEPGERYDEIAATTRHILATPRATAEQLAARCVARLLDEQAIGTWRQVRLRDLVMPVWADFYYELVFHERCDPEARGLIVANANDVVTALKCCGLRHMKTRDRLTRFLIRKLEDGELPHRLPERLSTRERALYLQGTFFNTAVVQTSEATAHLLLALAQHGDVQERLAADPEDTYYLDRVLSEAQRLYPLFGVAHRITSADITIDDRVTIPAGAVLTFNYPAYHRAGFDDPDLFDPDRWERISAREANHIPFGVTANRACPARGLAPPTVKAAARDVLRRFALYSSVAHTRSLPNRGTCLLVSRTGHLDPRLRWALLQQMRVRDRWEDVWRSLVQLVLGTYMVWDARRLRLCQRYFDTHQGEPATSRPDSSRNHSARCVPTNQRPGRATGR